jgi:hypothetical protein
MTHVSNRLEELIKIGASVVNKQSFIDGASAAGAPPMDPMAGGGGPPMDPAMMDPAMMDPAMMGGDPAAMGGAPMGGAPMDPAMMGMPPEGGGGGDPTMIAQAVIQAMQASGMGGGGGGPTGAEPGIKPKIDVNVEIMQMKKILARIADTLGIQIPAAEMVATPDDLNQIAEGGAGNAAITPDGGGGGGMGGSAIGTINPLQGASPELAKSGVDGEPYDGSGLSNLGGKAAAMARILSR